MVIKSDSMKAETSSDKAEELNNHFRSVFTTEYTNNIPESNNYFNGEKPNTIEISTEIIKNKVLKLTTTKHQDQTKFIPNF